MCKQTVHKIKLTKYDRNRAEKFADEREKDTDLYKRRGNFKREDIVTGALGEIAAYKLLREYDFKINKPDFKIYEKSKKSFDADLVDATRHFHIKSQNKESVIKYTKSWILQREDKLLTKEQKGHYVIPCIVDLETNEVEILCVTNIETIKKNHMIGELKIPWLQKYKVALYWDDLKGLSYNARWGVLKR